MALPSVDTHLRRASCRRRLSASIHRDGGGSSQRTGPRLDRPSNVWLTALWRLDRALDLAALVLAAVASLTDVAAGGGGAGVSAGAGGELCGWLVGWLDGFEPLQPMCVSHSTPD